VSEWIGSTLEMTRISRLDMGNYLCIASNSVPPSVSKQIKVSVDCEYTSPLPANASDHLRTLSTILRLLLAKDDEPSAVSHPSASPKWLSIHPHGLGLFSQSQSRQAQPSHSFPKSHRLLITYHTRFSLLDSSQ
jgi:hypothetical protein